jgi:anti-sigma-K factor RskA
MRMAVAGAVGAVGFAVFYFLDPEEGPRRRRQALEALHEAALEAWRLSQELVGRLAEPVGARPPAARAERQAPAPETDLASTLHDEVSFFRVDSPPAEEEPVHAVVGAPEEERFDAEERLIAAERFDAEERPIPAERVSYIHSVGTAQAPRPTIISYDPVPEEVEPELEYAAARPADSVRSTSTRGAFAAVAAVLVLLGAAALGAWAIWGGNDESSNTAIPSGASEAIQLISQPGARSVSVAGSKGTMVLVVAPNGQAALIVSGLTKAPPGKEYQAWVVTGKTPKSAGLFKGGNTRLVIPLGQRIPKGAIFAVTVERAGGVPAPTQAPRFTAKLS